MNRFLEYTLFFVVLLLLQVFLFNNLDLSVYLSPLVYIVFLIMLPVKINSGLLLLLGLLTGITADFFMGTGGINTIASLFTAFVRPWVLNLTVGSETVREGGIPSPSKYGTAGWLKYASLVVAGHCVVFFMFEALSFRHFGFTLLRMVCSFLFTMLFVWFISAVYPLRERKG